MLDGFNSGWIDFDPDATEHVHGIRTQEEVFQDLIRRAG
jgi:NAD(P)H dehydrogenase (quinone)